jgi:hypothetical protein
MCWETRTKALYILSIIQKFQISVMQVKGLILQTIFQMVLKLSCWIVGAFSFRSYFDYLILYNTR